MYHYFSKTLVFCYLGQTLHPLIQVGLQSASDALDKLQQPGGFFNQFFNVPSTVRTRPPRPPINGQSGFDSNTTPYPQNSFNQPNSAQSGQQFNPQPRFDQQQQFNPTETNSLIHNAFYQQQQFNQQPQFNPQPHFDQEQQQQQQFNPQPHFDQQQQQFNQQPQFNPHRILSTTAV